MCAVAIGTFERGYVGFIGDVNHEEETWGLVVTMLRTLRPAPAPPKAPSKNPSAKKTNTAAAPPGPRLPDPASWAQGLSQPKKYEWLVDCYRMRVDDDYAMGGGNLRGLYNQPADKVLG